MEKRCGFCGKPIERFSRSTKKYCNDNCKQLAYYARIGKQWGDRALAGTQDQPLTIPFNVKPDFTVNENGHKLEEQQVPVSIEKNPIPYQEPSSEVKQHPENFTVIKNETAAPVKNYEWVSSDLLDAVEQIRGDSEAEYKFCNADHVWGSANIPYFIWVSERLRCLIENILRMSAYRKVDCMTVVEISKAFNNLYDSWLFRLIQKYFPYSSLLVRLRKLFNDMASSSSLEGFSLQLSMVRKAELIAARFAMAAITQKKSFYDLDFSDGIREDAVKKYSKKE